MSSLSAFRKHNEGNKVHKPLDTFYLNYPQSNEVGKSDHMVNRSEKKVLEEMRMHGNGEVTFNLLILSDINQSLVLY